MMSNESRSDEFQPNRFSPVRLFAERVAANWIAIWKSWRTVLDWAAWLYILLPGSFIFVGMYRDMLRDPPVWLDENLFPLIVIVLGLAQLIGKYRTFAEPGDGLFLHRKPRWIRGKIVSGFIYGIITRILLSTAVVAVASPLMLQIFELTGTDLFAVVIYCSAFGFVWMLLRDRLTQRWRGWRKALLLFSCFLVFMTVFVGLAGLGEELSFVLGLAIIPLTAIAAWLMMLRMRMQGTLLHEISVENSLYAANVRWILKETMDKKPAPMLRRPMLFNRSQPLLKHRDDTHRLLDSWFKSALRRIDLLTPIAYFTGAGVAATILPPLPLAIIVWLILPMLLLSLLHRQWLSWLTEPYIALFRWRAEIHEQASRKVRIGGALPSMTLWALVIGTRIGLSYGGIGWLAIAILPAVGYFWLQFVNHVFKSIKAFRQE